MFTCLTESNIVDNHNHQKLRGSHAFDFSLFQVAIIAGLAAASVLAQAKVTSNLAENNRGLAQVYQLTLPGDQGVLIGVAMAPLDEDDKYYNDVFQMSVVDIAPVRSTAYLPYEILISGGKVQALHMRFRMAVHFPDLSMMGKHSFMTLMPSPTAIEKALKTLAE